MGDSIKELVKSLGSSAVQNILAATVLTAVASAVLWPVFLVRSSSSSSLPPLNNPNSYPNRSS
jgi:hypothetical protein